MQPKKNKRNRIAFFSLQTKQNKAKQEMSKDTSHYNASALLQMKHLPAIRKIGK
jgi:hypothetical protein